MKLFLFYFFLISFLFLWLVFQQNSELTLKEKIAQMILVHVENETEIKRFAELGISNFHLGWHPKEEYFERMIGKIRRYSKFPPLIATDMEGCLNPFSSFKNFPNASEIENETQAYSAGLAEGRVLRKFGFNLNFAPVLDLKDNVWRCRAFKGNATEITEKALAYIKGLKDSGILSIVKHYPGKSMATKDPHKELVYAKIGEEDLLPFKKAFEFGVDGVMVSHVIATGKVNSEGKPCSVSRNVIEEIKNDFKGLVISDDISMLGLRKFYKNETQMWIDLFKAGNDVIIVSNYSPEKIERLIEVIEEGVREGIINEKDIDRSVQKILEIKRASNIYK